MTKDAPTAFTRSAVQSRNGVYYTKNEWFLIGLTEKDPHKKINKPRDYKKFDQDIFSPELWTSLSSKTVHDYTSFEENFSGVLNKHASLKK